MAERTSLILYRNSDVKVTYPFPSGYNLFGFSPSFYFRTAEGESPTLTITSTPTANGSTATVVGDAVVLVVKALDASLFPSVDIFNGVYDSTLTKDGFVNRFVGGPMTVFVDGSYGEGVFSDSVFITLSGMDVPVLIEGGNLGIAASAGLADLDQAVSAAEAAANDAAAAAGSAVASLSAAQSLLTLQVKIVSSTTYTILPSDRAQVILFTSPTGVVVTIPLGLVGYYGNLIPIGTGSVTVSSAMGVTVYEPDGNYTSEAQYVVLSLLGIGMNTYVLSGRTTN